MQLLGRKSLPAKSTADLTKAREDIERLVRRLTGQRLNNLEAQALMRKVDRLVEAAQQASESVKDPQT